MKFVRPTAITPAMLLASNVPESDYPEWAAGTFAVGDFCIVAAQHKVYKCAVAGVSALSPELDPTRWGVVGATNRHAMFDDKVGTVTRNTDSISVTLAPGRFNSLGVLNADAARVDIELIVDGETAYSKSLDLVSRAKVGNWYDYFYEPIYQEDTVVLTDLLDAALLDLPATADGILTVTLSRPGGTVSCGSLVVGMLFTVGQSKWGTEVGIRDFSGKEADLYGNYALIKRDYSKTMKATVLVERGRSDEVARTIARYRATYLLWIGSPSHGSQIVFGFVNEWRLVFENTVFSGFSLEVEG